MPRPRDPNKKVQLSVRLKPDVKKATLKQAKKNKESASELVGRAVEAYLDGRLIAAE